MILLGFVKTAMAAVTNPLDAPTLGDFIKAVANIVMQIGGVVVVVFIIWSGFLFVTARGSEEQLKKARTVFFWTIIGGVILLGAYVIAVALVAFVNSLS